MIDVSLAITLGLILVRALHLSPVPHKSWTLGFAATLLLFRVLLPWIGTQLLGHPPGSGFARTPGEMAWSEAPFTGGLLTVAALTATFVAADQVAFSQPLWAQAEIVRLQPFMPPAASGLPEWQVNAFFYTLGAWPTRYRGKPVFYSLPYEKGPPAQFIGEIRASWDTGVRVTLEGPKTPLSYLEGIRTRPELQSCMTAPVLGSPSGSGLGALGCLRLREKSLQRHIAAMSRVHPQSWKIRWFVVENPAIPPEDQAQGVYLEADGLLLSQSRYVLVTDRGVHEAIIASYPSDPEDAARARDTLEKVVSSLRVSDDLNPGRAWADQQIESVHLEELKTITDPDTLASRLAQIEATLLSKISVEPKAFDAYFHLGGIAMMIAREGARAREPEWQASAGMLPSLLRYAKDVSPQDPRIVQLENLWLESKDL